MLELSAFKYGCLMGLHVMEVKRQRVGGGGMGALANNLFLISHSEEIYSTWQ